MQEPLVTISLAGPPRGKGRPRFRIIKPRGGAQFVSTYTDAATRAYEERLMAAGRVAYPETDEPLDGPLWVDVTAFMAIPASWSKRDRAAAANLDLLPTSKPDADNFAKCVDALNGVVWRDDSQIVRLITQKFYSERPRLVVKVWRWADV